MLKKRIGLPAFAFMLSVICPYRIYLFISDMGDGQFASRGACTHLGR